MIKKTLPNKLEILKVSKIITVFGKLFNECPQKWQGFSESILQVLLFTVLYLKWSAKKHCVAKFLLALRVCFYHFFVLLKKRKRRIKILARKTSVFCLQQVVLYFTGIPNSIGFYKGIFLFYALKSFQACKISKTRWCFNL